MIGGDIAGSLTAFLRRFDNDFGAFVVTLDITGIGCTSFHRHQSRFYANGLCPRIPLDKYLVGMIIYQLVFFPWIEDYQDDIQYSFNARLWKRYEPCQSDEGLSEVDKKLLRDAGFGRVADKQVFLTETHFSHPLRRRHPISECHTSIKELFQDLGISRVEARNKYFGALGRWDREQLENAGYEVFDERVETWLSGEIRSRSGGKFKRREGGTVTAGTVASQTTGDGVSISTYRSVWEETTPNFRLEPF
jgi:hypothetical protein